jgi:hypothetical protein
VLKVLRYALSAGLILLGHYPDYRRLLLRLSPDVYPHYFSSALYLYAMLQIYNNSKSVQKNYGHSEHNQNVGIYNSLGIKFVLQLQL